MYVSMEKSIYFNFIYMYVCIEEISYLNIWGHRGTKANRVTVNATVVGSIPAKGN